MDHPPRQAGRITRRGLLTTWVVMGAATSCTLQSDSAPATLPVPPDPVVADLARAWQSSVPRAIDPTASRPAAPSGERGRSAFDQVWNDTSSSAALWASLSGLGLTDFGVAPAATGPGRARFEVRWQVSGDRSPARSIIDIGVAREQGRWRLQSPATAAAGSDIMGTPQPLAGPRPIWWVEPIRTRQADAVTVLAGTGNDPELIDRLLDAGDRALHEAVRRTGRQLDRVILELPTTPQGMDALLGSDQGSRGRLSAVTRPVGPRAEASPLRVVVNPLVVRTVPAALATVLTHEVTHVLTQAPEQQVPLWVAEGYAELVAHADHDPGAWVAAEPFLEQVAAGRVPPGPPDADEFADGDLRVAYGHAWSRCRWLLEASSWSAVNQWYADLAGGTDPDQTYRRACGLDAGAVQEAWRAWIVSRATTHP